MTIRLTRMPFEKYSLIITHATGGEPSVEDVNTMMDWIGSNTKEWTYQGGIISFKNEKDLSWTLLRWYGS